MLLTLTRTIYDISNDYNRYDTRSTEVVSKDDPREKMFTNVEKSEVSALF